VQAGPEIHVKLNKKNLKTTKNNKNHFDSIDIKGGYLIAACLTCEGFFSHLFSWVKLHGIIYKPP
jgi:hypothetical protein